MRMTLLWIAITIIAVLTVISLILGAIYFKKKRPSRLYSPATLNPIPPSPSPPPPVIGMMTGGLRGWWSKVWGSFIITLIAYALFWICLSYFSQTTSDLSTKVGIFLLGLGILAIIFMASPKWASVIMCAILLVTFSLRLIGMMNTRGPVPEYDPKIGMVPPPPTLGESVVPTLLTSSASITLSAEDGWVPIKVLSTVGKTWVSKTDPQTSKVYVRRPDGKVREAGYCHENDTWPSEQRSHQEWQTWFVSTDSTTTVTYTVTWAN